MVLDTLEYGSAIKKTPVVVGNCTGFAVNRVFFPYTQAACLLVDLGLDPYKIDKAIPGRLWHAHGPLQVSLLPISMSSIPLLQLHGIAEVATTATSSPALALFPETIAYCLHGYPGLWTSDQLLSLRGICRVSSIEGRSKRRPA